MPITDPLQDRSRATRDSLLEAAERLLESQPWNAISVQRLAREAGFTTGAIYGRFGGKQEVLPLLLDRLQERIEASLGELEAEAATRSGAETLDLLVEQLVALYRDGGDLLRSLREAARDDASLERRIEELNLRIIDRLRGLLAGDRGLPENDPRVDVALLLLIAPIRELLVERAYWPASALDFEQTVAEIQRAVRGYLEAAP